MIDKIPQDWAAILRDVVSLLAVIGFLIAAWWNNYAGRNRTPSQNQLDSSTAMDTLNISIARAIKRADDAERSSDEDKKLLLSYKKDAEKKINENKLALIELKYDFDRWKKEQKFVISFTMIMTDEPEILNVEAYRERRKEQLPFEEERRKE